MFALIFATLLAAAPAADFPYDQDFESGFGVNSNSVKFTYRVTKSGDKYTYLYSVKNTGKTPIKFRCSTLQNVMSFFGWNNDMIYDLEPDEHINFVLEHPDSPIVQGCMATIYKISDKDEFDKENANTPNTPKNIKLKVPNKKFYKGNNGYLRIAIPQSLVGAGR